MAEKTKQSLSFADKLKDVLGIEFYHSSESEPIPTAVDSESNNCRVKQQESTNDDDSSPLPNNGNGEGNSIIYLPKQEKEKVNKLTDKSVSMQLADLISRKLFMAALCILRKGTAFNKHGSAFCTLDIDEHLSRARIKVIAIEGDAASFRIVLFANGTYTVVAEDAESK